MKTFTNSSTQTNTTLETARLGVIAGAAGGLAEIAWVTLYASASGADPALVARGVTTAAGAGALLPLNAVALGVSVHMVIALALGVALAFVWRTMPTSRAATPLPFAMVALAGVWAINFFVVLPIVSPGFIDLLPYSASLISKLSFGLAAGGVFQFLGAPAARLGHAQVADRT